MRKISIAVCDTDRTYGQKLGEWISLEKGGRVCGSSFSTPENFLEFQKKGEVDVVLLGSGFWEEPAITAQMKEAVTEQNSAPELKGILPQNALGVKETLPQEVLKMKKELPQEVLKVKKELSRGDAEMEGIVSGEKAAAKTKGICSGEMLQRGQDSRRILWIYLEDPTARQALPDLAQNFPVIRKYQAASQIVREIFFYYQKLGILEQEPALTGREILGVYSPDHSIWQTPFALTLAQTLSPKERALYVSFRECAGFEEWLGESYTRDLLDVMYLCLTGKGNISDCVGSAVYTLEGFDYVPPARDSECLGEVSSRDYLQFIKLLAEKSGYDVFILDLGMMVSGFFGLLELCSKVYIVSDSGELPGNARKHFKQIAARQDNVQLEQKISYLQLPEMNEGFCRREKMQQWIWGELGDYTRRIAGVQGGTD